MGPGGVFAVIVLMLVGGCTGVDGLVSSVWEPNFFDRPPAPVGPFAVREFRVGVQDGADGEPTGITVFAPVEAHGPRPAFVWVLGSNVQAYYHQSLHETLASWGYVVIVPDARPLTFTDSQYHHRNTDLARQAIQLGLNRQLGVEIDADRIGVGGYSIGATMALFVAAEDPRVDAVVLWAPTSSARWTGVNPEELYPRVRQPVYFLLAERDHVEPPTGFPDELRRKLVNAPITQFVIAEGLHLYFQQPTGADSAADPESSLTRFEQQGIAIQRTLDWLDQVLDVVRN